jgi:transposase InsO family protein
MPACPFESRNPMRLNTIVSRTPAYYEMPPATGNVSVRMTRKKHQTMHISRPHNSIHTSISFTSIVTQSGINESNFTRY